MDGPFSDHELAQLSQGRAQSPQSSRRRRRLVAPHVGGDVDVVRQLVDLVHDLGADMGVP